MTDSRRILAAAVLEGAETGRVKTLPGFSRRRGHWTPDGFTDAAAAFVRRAGDALVQERAESLYRDVRDTYGWKRRELVFAADDGEARLRAPGFAVALRLDQAEASPERYALTTRVGGFESAAVLEDPRLTDLFAGRCDAVCLAFARPVDLEERIDRIEDAGIAASLDYAPDASWLAVEAPDRSVRMTLTTNGARFETPLGGRLDTLIQGASRLVEALAPTSGAPFFAIDSPDRA